MNADRPQDSVSRPIELLSGRRVVRQASLITAWLPLLACLLLAQTPVAAQQPILSYTLTVNTNDLSRVQVAMRLRGLPATFHLAMARHFLAWQVEPSWKNLEVTEIIRGTITPKRDGLWRVDAPGGDTEIRYSIRLDARRYKGQVQRPFLTPTGGLFGDLQMFMYVVEAPQAAAHVVLHLPPDWKVATALTPTADPRHFYARNAEELCDSPILAGQLREWRFLVEQTPIRVAYWPLPEAKAFNEQALVDDLRKLVQAAANLFGGLPFREYLFQIRDGVMEEGLEHFDCVTLGISSASLAASDGRLSVPSARLVAHEFLHAWNMMRIHPVEYKGPDNRQGALSGLWFSEGFTMFYADLLLHRAGLVRQTELPAAVGPTRVAHLEEQIGWYLGERLGARGSAENASRFAYSLATGDHPPEVWTQGELIAAMLDFQIRDETNGKRTLDDLMRRMFAQFSAARGFSTADVQRLASEVCGRNLSAFFNAYVRGGRPLDFNRYLALAGLKMDVEWKTSKLADGAPFYTLLEAKFYNGESAPRLYLWDTNNAWGRAGLRTGDELLRFNGSPVETVPDFMKFRDALRSGDNANLEVRHDEKIRQATVTIGSYDWPIVKIQELPNRTERQKAIFTRWSAGQ